MLAFTWIRFEMKDLGVFQEISRAFKIFIRAAQRSDIREK